MIIKETPISNVYIIEPDINDKFTDNRGLFTRIFDKNKLFSKFINFNIVQTSLSHNNKKGTIRGLHYQDTPFFESKIVNCPRGSIYDIALDLREESKTYKQYFSIELSSTNNISLYIPPLVAHGFQTLEDNTTVLYCMNKEYHYESAKTINYHSYNIQWKEEPTEISEKDKNAPLLE